MYYYLIRCQIVRIKLFRKTIVSSSGPLNGLIVINFYTRMVVGHLKIELSIFSSLCKHNCFEFQCQVWDWLFKSCEVNGRILIRDVLISLKDVGECILTGDCKKLGVKLPAWSILQCLLRSAKSDSSGLMICMYLSTRTCP